MRHGPGLATLILGVLLAACYTLRPAGGALPEVGRRIAFDVTDAGRVALGGTMGPEIAQIEGLVVEKDSSGYLLSVAAVRLLRGGEQVWSGEPVRLKPEYLSNTYQRRFSLGRSIALGVVGVGGFSAFLVSRSLFASGTEDRNGDDSDTVTTRLTRP
jgi:hypothetical protein